MIDADAANPLVFDGRKLIPNVSRTFSAARPVHVFLQAYEQDASSARPLVAYAALYQAGEKRLETTPLGMPNWNAASRAVPIWFTASLTGIEPGEYECQVTVLDPGSGRAAFWRTTIVVVR